MADACLARATAHLVPRIQCDGMVETSTSVMSVVPGRWIVEDCQIRYVRDWTLPSMDVAQYLERKADAGAQSNASIGSDKIEAVMKLSEVAVVVR